ncbi:MAG: hypothetical protein ACRD3Q_14800 [Terriglobales bacterium]
MADNIKDSPFAEDVTVRLGGKDLHLSFPLPSVWLMEDLTGIKVTSGEMTGDEIQAKFAGMKPRERMEYVITSCYAALHANHPEYTREQVANLISIRNMKYVNDQVERAMAAARPIPEEESGEAAEAPLADAKPGA